MQHKLWTLLFWYAIGLGCLVAESAEGPPADATAFAMSLTEFWQLPSPDQRFMIVRAFEHRLKHARSVTAEVKVRMGNYEYTDGKIGRQLVVGNGRNYRIWRLGDTIRTDCISGGPIVERPSQFLSSSFDASKSLTRSTIHNADKSRCYGRIDIKPDSLTAENRFAYWLDGEDIPMGEYLFRYLITHKDQFSIVPSDRQGLVRLTVPWQPHFSDKALGQREFTLDPVKGFMPVHGKGRWDRVLSDGRKDWRSEEFYVDESILVADVWMPTKLRELIGGGPLGDKKISVWDTTATDLVHGKVSPKDVEVEFPPGAKVVDAIQGIAYTVGPDLKPTEIEQLIGDRGLPVPRPRSWWPYIVGSVLAIIALVFVLRVRSRHRMVQSRP
mgnify:FL=1